MICQRNNNIYFQKAFLYLKSHCFLDIHGFFWYHYTVEKKIFEKSVTKPKKRRLIE